LQLNIYIYYLTVPYKRDRDGEREREQFEEKRKIKNTAKNINFYKILNSDLSTCGLLLSLNILSIK
jgi:hypothetical protein